MIVKLFKCDLTQHHFEVTVLSEDQVESTQVHQQEQGFYVDVLTEKGMSHKSNLFDKKEKAKEFAEVIEDISDNRLPTYVAKQFLEQNAIPNIIPV